MNAKEQTLFDKFLRAALVNHGHLADCPEDVAALAWEACLDAHLNEQDCGVRTEMNDKDIKRFHRVFAKCEGYSVQMVEDLAEQAGTDTDQLSRSYVLGLHLFKEFLKEYEPELKAAAVLQEIVWNNAYAPPADSDAYLLMISQGRPYAWIRKIAAKHGLDLDALKGE